MMKHRDFLNSTIDDLESIINTQEDKIAELEKEIERLQSIISEHEDQ
jgi:prefoldin subunit 5